MRLDLSRLSPSQRAAVTCDGAVPLQILAGPGSGKTRVLTTRVAWLVLGDEERAPMAPEHCVVVTFTNKAAQEMRTRLHALIGEGSTRKLILGTFHATCAQFLRRHGARIAVANNFTIADVDDVYVCVLTSKRMLKGVLEEQHDSLQAGDLAIKPEQLLTEISKAKARSWTPARLRTSKAAGSTVVSPWTLAMADLYEAYQAKLRESNALDFDDLLMYGAQLFREHPSVGRSIQHGTCAR